MRYVRFFMFMFMAEKAYHAHCIRNSSLSFVQQSLNVLWSDEIKMKPVQIKGEYSQQIEIAAAFGAR